MCYQAEAGAEPALREGLPLKRSEWTAYLQWAVNCFRLASSGIRDETQVQTHMCYSEFNDIIDAIAGPDADVTLIESARSKMDVLEAFRKFRYPNDIGPGVYDIHTPRCPSVEEMAESPWSSRLGKCVSGILRLPLPERSLLVELRSK